MSVTRTTWLLKHGNKKQLEPVNKIVSLILIACLLFAFRSFHFFFFFQPIIIILIINQTCSIYSLQYKNVHSTVGREKECFTLLSFNLHWYQSRLRNAWKMVSSTWRRHYSDVFNILTHSHTTTPFDASGKQTFWKHCGKRRNCS